MWLAAQPAPHWRLAVFFRHDNPDAL